MVFLRRLRWGVYGRSLQENEGMPLIIVHPYFSFERTFLGKQTSRALPGDCVGDGYLRLLEERVVAHPGPIITLEEGGRMGSTAARYAQLGRVEHSYFIPTMRASPRTLFGEFSELLGLLDRFPARPVAVAGGYLDPDIRYSAGVGGCLGVTMSALQDGGISHRVLEGLTFSRSEHFSSAQPSRAHGAIPALR